MGKIAYVIFQIAFLFVMFFWTLSLGTQNGMQIEKTIKEFCGENAQYRVNKLTGDYAIILSNDAKVFVP